MISSSSQSTTLPCKIRTPLVWCVLLLVSISHTSAFDYSLASAGSLRLVDVATNFSDIRSLFRGASAKVYVEDLVWQSQPEFVSNNLNDSMATRTLLYYNTSLNGQVVAEGSLDLSAEAADTVPPTSVAVGEIVTDRSGRQNVTVSLQVVQQHTSVTDESQVESSQTTTPIVSTFQTIQSFRAWISILPFVILVVLAFLTKDVEISLTLTVMISAILVTGSLFQGMKQLLEVYILNALTTKENGSIMLFVFFFSGICAVMEKGGGFIGWVQYVAKHVHTTRAAQLIGFGAGCGLFFDDVLSVMIVGTLMKPLMDVAHSSRPLVAWIADATAVPLVCLTPLSSWIGWQVRVIQQELDRLQLEDGAEDLSMSTDALTVFKRSLKYHYYPILLLVLVPLLMWTQRHLGPMLVSERRTQVYQRRDGGEATTQGPGPHYPNNPAHETPCRPWNALIPLGLVTILFLIMMVETGIKDANSLVDVFVNGNGMSALLQAVATSFFLTLLTYVLQMHQNGNVLFLPLNISKLMKQSKHHTSEDESLLQAGGGASLAPRPTALLSPPAAARADEASRIMYDQLGTALSPEDDESLEVVQQIPNDPTSSDLTTPDEVEPIVPLMPLQEIVDTFFFGFGRVMPFIIQLMLAWAATQGMKDVGTDRWMATWLVNDETSDVRSLPTVAFLASFFLSYATGLTRGTAASLLLPLVIVPTYEASGGNANLVYAVIGAVFSGCVAGDHGSPISTSTVLASLSSDCNLICHAKTQTPYVVMLVIVSVLVGTLPVGYDSYPNAVAYVLGVPLVVMFVFGMCRPVLDPSGQWDVITTSYVMLGRLVYGVPTSKDSSDDTTVEEEENPDYPRDPYKDEWAELRNDTMDAAAAMAEMLASRDKTNDPGSPNKSIMSGGFGDNNKSGAEDEDEAMPATSNESTSAGLTLTDTIAVKARKFRFRKKARKEAKGRHVLIIATDGSVKEDTVYSL